MSVQTLYTAATGMNSLDTKLDVMANNLANSNTTAFKAARVQFRRPDVPATQVAGLAGSAGQLHAHRHRGRLGNARAGHANRFHARATSRKPTARSDVAINGRGFFQVLDPFTGQTIYTRQGDWSINSNYQLVIGSAQTGYVIQPPITLPQDMTEHRHRLRRQGAGATVQQPELHDCRPIAVGQLHQPRRLVQTGQNLFQQTDSSGPPLLANPGQNGLGTLNQSTLEAVERRPGARTDRSDHHPALVRTQFAGRAGRATRSCS